MRIVLSIVIISIIYIWRNTQITTPIIIDDSPTILQNSQTIQNKLKEIGKIEILNVEYQNDYKASLQSIELLKNNKKYKKIVDEITNAFAKDEIIMTAKWEIVVWFDFKNSNRSLQQSWDTLMIQITSKILDSKINSIGILQQNKKIINNIIDIDLTWEEQIRQEWIKNIINQAMQDDILNKTYVLWEQVIWKIFEVFWVNKVVITSLQKENSNII